MTKIAFAGFGEVNTPVDIIINKCKAASESLKSADTEVIAHFPIRDDYEEKDVNAAIDFFKGKDFEAGRQLENVHITDLAPTIVKLFGAIGDEDWEGKSLF